MNPLAHVKALVLHRSHFVKEDIYCLIDIGLKHFKGLSRVYRANQTPLRAMNRRVSFAEKIKCTAALKHAVEVAL